MKHLVFLLCVLIVSPVAQAQEVLTLREAIDLAVGNNYSIRIARNDVEVASNDYTRGNAGFLPVVDLNAAYNGTIANTNQSFISGQSNVVDGAQTTRQSVGAILNWTLFEGFGRVATLDRLKAQYNQQKTVAANTTESIVANVIVSYYDLARQQQQLQVLQEAVAISEERLRIAELRLDLGSASELEVRQARLDLNTDRAATLRQETFLINTKSAFNQLLVRPLSLEYTVEDSINVAMNLPQAILLTEAESRNVTLKIAEQEKMVSALEIKEIRGERFPSLSLNAGLNYADLTAESGFLLSNRSDDFSYGLSLNFNIFDGFNHRRRLNNATIRLQNAELLREDIRTRLETDVRRTYKDYENSLALIVLEEENLGLARQNVEIALERFRLGTITSIELREVQETLIRAQSQLLVARFEAKRAETELLQLSGRLMEAE